jgi:hypothetical protein
MDDNNNLILLLTATIYNRICAILMPDYQPVQRSVYEGNTTAVDTWFTTFDLRTIEPLGVFATTVRDIRMFRIPILAMIATQDIRLGGQHSPHLLGQTPIALVPPHVPHNVDPMDPNWAI